MVFFKDVQCKCVTCHARFAENMNVPRNYLACELALHYK